MQIFECFLKMLEHDIEWVWILSKESHHDWAQFKAINVLRACFDKLATVLFVGLTSSNQGVHTWSEQFWSDQNVLVCLAKKSFLLHCRDFPSSLTTTRRGTYLENLKGTEYIKQNMTSIFNKIFYKKKYIYVINFTKYIAEGELKR